jgi:delta14-sterol reductase/lamin-B receptor
MSEPSLSALGDESATRAEPRTANAGFGGPWGALGLMTFMPGVSFYLFACVHLRGGALAVPSVALFRELPLPTLRVTVFFIAWLVLQVVLDLSLPGKPRSGLPQPDGRVLSYKLNGLASLGVSLALLAAGYVSGALPLGALWDERGPLLAVSTIATFALTAILYVLGLASPYREKRTGHRISDFFLGTALNPRLGNFDLKFFFESKIGMTTWIVMTLGTIPAAIDRHGTIDPSLAFVCAFQLVYVVDFYVFEEAMLTTWDINHENFGFMLAFAFLVWMPFNFSLQSEYLVDHHPELPAWALAAVALLNVAGYVVFRTSNLQKHKFRTDPETRIWGKKPAFITTGRGSRLLTSGWWGLARHANYFGDFAMAVAWSLMTGFSRITPYFYVLYFAPLLVHRERRDYAACKEKYGADWEEYCRRVPYRIIPGVY